MLQFHPVDIQDVTSSVLAAVGYDRERRVLEARFRTGRVYHYFDVPYSIFKQLLSARSKGQYFNTAIRPRRSEERRVGKECRSRWAPDHVKKKKTISQKRAQKVTY